MAVDAEQIEEIVRETVDLYRGAEQAILDQVTRHLADGHDAPDWAARRLGALATLRTAVQRILAVVQRDGAVSIRAALAAAYRAGSASALFGIPARLLPRDPDAVRAPAALAEVPRASVIEDLATALVRDVGERHSNVLRDVLDTYRRVIAQATAASVAGGLTRREASQMAYARFVDRGLTGFTDRAARRWRLSSYVEMAVRTVTQRAAIQGQTDRQTRLGLPYVVVSNEAQECERCRPYEGKVLRIDAGPTGQVQATNPATGAAVTVQVTATLDSARAAGFQHPNCRHSVRAYLPGVTRLPEPPTADPDGDLARQRQRKFERNIRRWKERERAALTPETKAGAKARVRLWQGKMRQHLAENPTLKRLPYREQIGAGNVPSRTSTPAPPAAPPLPQRQPVRQEPSRVKDLPDLLQLDYDAQVNRSMARDVFADIIGGDYAGLTVEVTDVMQIPDGSHPGILVRGKIYPEGDLDADAIGEVARGFYRDRNGDLVAIHALLHIKRQYRGQGFAGAFNGHLEQWYRQQNIVRIEVHANIDVGGYTWATQGYQFEDAESAEGVLERFRFVVTVFEEQVEAMRTEAESATAEHARTLRAQARKLEAQLSEAADILERADDARFGDDDYPTAWEISQCGRSHDIDVKEQPWIGKAAMLGSDWQGVKWL